MTRLREIAYCSHKAKRLFPKRAIPRAGRLGLDEPPDTTFYPPDFIFCYMTTEILLRASSRRKRFIDSQTSYILSTLDMCYRTLSSTYLTPSASMIASRVLCSTRTILNRTRFNPGRRFASTSPLTINPSRDELSHGRLTSRNLEKAVRSLHEDGLVVIEDAIPHEDLDRLNTKMVKDALHLQSRGKDMPFNYNVGNSMSFSHPQPNSAKTILTAILSPARPSANEGILPSINLPEPSRHPNNKHPPRSKPKMDFLLW